nr:DUF6801 domain-containing protein [Kibdelosporangium sp. MJ126-NF4]CEL14853.1 hypothetical protein [Kibdelosporangium sp. MJ126-NF4]CTQ96516.1 hypothetical protein [Kibdelosporangium sp. MJ126-NF4]
MSPAISRRTAITGATGALVAVAVGATATPAHAAGDLVWSANINGAVIWDITTRIVTRLPTSARYGAPIALGTIIVQARCSGERVKQIRQAKVTHVSGTGKCGITATDARGLSAPFAIEVAFPETPIPDTDVEFTITGTAVITGPLPLPLPRNRGPMRIAVDPTATARMDGKRPHDKPLPGIIKMTLKSGQDPTLTTIDIR